jgi:DNA mismatch endonuclease (patch repair protein)
LKCSRRIGVVADDSKLVRNGNRDRVVSQTLRRAGWRVLRIWECDLAKHPETCIHRILEALS